jgi:YggT family protein
VFVVSNLVLALAGVLKLVINVYIWIIIARAIISWVSPDPSNPIVRFLYRATEPLLRPIRYRLPTVAMGIDLSPIVLILVLYFLDQFLVSTLRELALSLR